MKRVLIVFGVIVLFLISLVSAVPVVPGAYGFGMDTRGAYGSVNDPEICIVDTLSSNPGSLTTVPDYEGTGVTVKKGSFPGCVTLGHVADTGRIILFEVGGTIDITGWGDLDFRYDNVWVAGQSAPSPGITIKGEPLSVHGDDVFIQHIRVRVGDDPDGGTAGFKRTAMNIATTEQTTNVVFDHVSTSWGTDQTAGASGDNITWWKSIISEGLNNPRRYDLTYENHCGDLCVNGDTWGESKTVIDYLTPYGGTEPSGTCEHPAETNDCLDPDCVADSGCDEFAHGTGLLAHSSAYSDGYAARISIIRNLFQHNNNRNPMINDERDTIELYLANNVVYNWGTSAIRLGGPNKVSAVGNLAIPGPSTVMLTQRSMLDTRSGRDFDIYVSDNYCAKGTAPTWAGDYCDEIVEADSCEGDDWKYTAPDAVGDTTQRCDEEVTGGGYSPITVVSDSGAALKAAVAADVGARPLDRDATDTRLIVELLAGTGTQIDSEMETAEGGWSTDTGGPRALSDLPSSPHADDDSDGYTDLEEWLHTFSCDVEGPQSESCISALPTCPQGQITSACLCGSVENSSGYCCSDSWQSTTCPSIGTIFSSVDSYLGDSSNWEELNPIRWDVVDEGGSLRYGIITTNYFNLSGSRLGEYSLIKNRVYNNFNFSAKVKSTEDFVANTGADYDIVFGYQDENNYYYMMFSSNVINTELEKIVNGNRATIMEGNFAIPDNNYHDVKVERLGDNIKIYFDGGLIVDAIDSTFSSGQIGIGGYNDASLWDDILVTAVSSCSQADSSGNSIVEIGELLTYISSWKSGSVSIGELLTAIGEWKNGC